MGLGREEAGAPGALGNSEKRAWVGVRLRLRGKGRQKLTALKFSFLNFLCLLQCVSHFSVHLNQLESLLKCRFWWKDSGMGPEVCLSNVLPGEAEEYQELRWGKEVGVGSVPSSLMNTCYWTQLLGWPVWTRIKSLSLWCKVLCISTFQIDYFVNKP